ncbi:ovostatin-like [Ascaphus truei]|uniref:ovostatin-like n=1 Tax=Ascaphus truei TaxID=8439 RepID=UPI003F597DC9
MCLRRLLLSVSLLCLIAGGRSDPQYALSVPSMLKSGEITTVCVNLVDHGEPLNLNVLLECNGENTTIFSEQVPATNTFKCSDFQVPTVPVAVPVFITFEATGQRIQHLERRSVVIDVMNDIHVIQLDKPIYKKGQKVQIRLISLNSKLQPVPTKYSMISISDPSGSRMTQWQNQESERGIVALNYQLNSEAALGSYSVTAETASSGSVNQVFSVEEYVLPRFGISMEIPTVTTILDEIISFKVTATYTYGQPVPGLLSGRLCRKYNTYYPGNSCNRNPDGICAPITGQLGSDGTFSGTADLTQFQLERSGLQMSFNFDFTVIEEGTGIQVTESQYVRISSQIARIDFDYQDMEQHYKRGIPYLVTLLLKDANEKPISNELIELQVNGKVVQNLTTNAEGRVEYEIDTSNFVQTELVIQANYKNGEQCFDSGWLSPVYSNAYRSVPRFYSWTGSFVDVRPLHGELSCGQSYNTRVLYSLSRNGVGEGVNTATFYYLVMSKAKIVKSGEQPVDLSNSLNGEFSINLEVLSDFAPGAELIVYAILQTEVIADSVHLDIEKCFKNKVSLNFSVDQGAPGSNVDLQLTAASRSLCGLRIIDSSLLLLNQNQQLTAESVYYALRYLSLYGYYVAGFNVEEPAPPCIDPNEQIFYNGLYYQPVSYYGEGDTNDVFRSAGLVFGTNATLRKPEVCGRGFETNIRPLFMATTSAKVVADAESAVITADGGAVTTVRKFFPEVWNFNLTTVSESGSIAISQVVPHTITQWQGSVFCVSEEEGFGMTKNPSIFTAFQEFFVEVSLPYSFVRGETLIIKSFVSNYMEQCMKVKVTLRNSDAFSAVLEEGDSDMCVCSGERVSYSWSVKAKSLGVISFSVTAETTHIGAKCDGPPDSSQPPRKDTVEQTVIVEAEGIEKEITYSSLVCVEGKASVFPISITPSVNTVQDSAKAHVTVIGDLLGHAVNNPESLIQMPTGCGEQNLAILMPIPFVLKYLNCTGQLTAEIQDRAVGFMSNGYIKQLGYRHSDGSFSAFGASHSQGSAWLTALTFWTFEQIKPYTFVDPNVQNQALIYLERLQNLNTGCFTPTGTLFNSALKGGAENDISFTAYVVAILLQSDYPGGQTLLRSALRCLDAASGSQQSLYNRALMFYAYRVAGNYEKSNALFEQLRAEATSKDGTIHWERTEQPDLEAVPFFYAPYASAEIEITAYILLGLTKGPPPSQEDKTYMAPITLWLARQQNSLGGYRSTADTVVVLQALAGYGCLVYKENANNQVRVSAQNAVIAQFNVDSSNRLVVQREALPTASGDYSISVTGSGCCLVQTTVRYNIPVPKVNSAFSLSVNTSSESCVNDVAYTFTIGIQVSYHGSRNQSNMAIIDLKMLSGYTVDYGSISELRQKVSKVEEKNNHVYLYLDSVSSETTSYSLKVEMGSRVQNFQPSFLKMYDYYESDENGVAELKHPCSKE